MYDLTCQMLNINNFFKKKYSKKISFSYANFFAIRSAKVGLDDHLHQVHCGKLAPKKLARKQNPHIYNFKFLTNFD